MSNSIDLNADEQRYEMKVGGNLAGFSMVHENDGAVTFTHTEIADEFEGQGLAAELVTWALDDVRGRGRRVVALCPYVRRFIQKHPEYVDLLA